MADNSILNSTYLYQLSNHNNSPDLLAQKERLASLLPTYNAKLRLNPNPEEVKKLLGKWTNGLKITDTYTNYFNLDSIMYFDNSGYAATGTFRYTETGLEYALMCIYDADNTYVRSNYLCVTAFSDGVTYGYYFINNIGEKSYSGEYYQGTPQEIASYYLNQTYDFVFVGVKNQITPIVISF